MKFKIIIVVIFLGLTQPFKSNAQIQESEFYKTAYNYLNDSIIKLNHVDAETLAKNCNECCVTGINLKFDSELHVANRFIKNDQGFPIGDFINKKYNFSKDCLRAIRLGTRECDLSNQVRDSLKTFWESYRMKDKKEISESLKDLISNKKDGFQVFFSDIYKGTLAAELKSFCLPYDEKMWQGSSTSFFFVFNKEGKIEEVYSGISIHYN